MGEEKQFRASAMIRPRMLRSVSEKLRTLFSKNFIHGESQAKEITTTRGAVLPVAFNV